MENNKIGFLEIENLKTKLDYYKKSIEIFDKYLEIISTFLEYNGQAYSKIEFNRKGRELNFYIKKVIFGNDILLGERPKKDYEFTDFELYEVVLAKNVHESREKCTGGRNEMSKSYNQVKIKKEEFEKEIIEMQEDLIIRQKNLPLTNDETEKENKSVVNKDEMKNENKKSEEVVKLRKPNRGELKDKCIECAEKIGLKLKEELKDEHVVLVAKCVAESGIEPNLKSIRATLNKLGYKKEKY